MIKPEPTYIFIKDLPNNNATLAFDFTLNNLPTDGSGCFIQIDLPTAVDITEVSFSSESSIFGGEITQASILQSSNGE